MGTVPCMYMLKSFSGSVIWKQLIFLTTEASMHTCTFSMDSIITLALLASTAHAEVNTMLCMQQRLSMSYSKGVEHLVVGICRLLRQYNLDKTGQKTNAGISVCLHIILVF